MSNNSYKARIILPTGVLFESNIDLARLPGEEGVFGVLKGHANLVANLQAGISELVVQEKTKSYYIHGGVANVTNDSLEILSDFALDLELIDAAKIKQKISKLEEELKQIDVQSGNYDLLSIKIDQYKASLNFIK